MQLRNTALLLLLGFSLLASADVNSCVEGSSCSAASGKGLCCQGSCVPGICTSSAECSSVQLSDRCHRPACGGNSICSKTCTQILDCSLQTCRNSPSLYANLCAQSGSPPSITVSKKTTISNGSAIQVFLSIKTQSLFEGITLVECQNSNCSCENPDEFGQASCIISSPTREQYVFRAYDSKGRYGETQFSVDALQEFPTFLILGLVLLFIILVYFGYSYLSKSVEAIETRVEKVQDEMTELKRRYMKREIDGVTFRKLWDEKEKELTELKALMKK